jgi:D-tyrosyl-tRNA(Tyr) deacylase
VLVQRVLRAAVTVDDRVVGRIDRPGLLALVGVARADGPAEADWAASKVAGLRVLRGDGGAAVSALDAGAPVLVVSQFTLYADTRRGRRPTWAAAAPGPVAEPLVARVVERLRTLGLEVATGAFGEHMLVESTGDGPVTLWLDSGGAQPPAAAAAP